MNDKDIDRMLGEVLKDLRIRNGYSMQYVADRLGFKNRSSIAHYESGRNSLTMTQFKQLCDLYKVDYKSIMSDIFHRL